ncbi:unnamed protein product, partial [Rotaria magnacalcarata]
SIQYVQNNQKYAFVEEINTLDMNKFKRKLIFNELLEEPTKKMSKSINSMS